MSSNNDINKNIDIIPLSLVYPINSRVYKNVLLIDTDVKDAQLFASSANDDTFPITYSRASTKTELSALLKTKFPNSNIDRIERIGLVFTSNGVTVKTFLDSKPFFTNDDDGGDGEQSVIPYSENVDFIISVLRDFNVKNIDYLACDTLNYPNWKNYYTIITKETGVIVGASNDKTGNIKYGGDWVMESTSQNIELIYFTKSIEYYSYLLDATSFHTVVFNTYGVIYGTGYNFYGQLGIASNDTTNRSILTAMPIPLGKIPKYISCGYGHTMVLMTDGTVYGTGLNNKGQLGIALNDTTNRSILTVMTIPNSKIPKYISCGYEFTIVLMTDGTVYGTGYNYSGQLGTGDTTNRSILTEMTIPNSKIPKYISCGYEFTIVLMTNGTVYGTGYNFSGQLGTGNTTNRSILTAMNIPNSKIPKYISCGSYTTIVLMTDNTIYGTGSNQYGQLGIASNDTTNRSILTAMNIPLGKTPKYISCGSSNTIVLMTDNTIYGTGNNLYGQLGIEVTYYVTSLTAMPIPLGKTAKYISCGDSHTIVLMEDGTIWGTGYNEVGQLGTGDTTDRSILTIMTGSNNTNISYIAGMTIVDDTPNSDICFPAGTKILTDQGIVDIETINPDMHTINNKHIVDITKTVSLDKYLVEFEKNALGLNCPTENTRISQKHKIYYKGEMWEAKTFLGKFDKVVKVTYNGEILYNVLMDEHSLMLVNNLVCETLHPDNIIAKLFTKKCKYNDGARDKIYGLLTDFLIKSDHKSYNKIAGLVK